MKETLNKKNPEIVVLPVAYDEIAYKGLGAWLYSGETMNTTEYTKQANVVERVVKLPRICAKFNNYMRKVGVPVSYREDENKFSYAALMSGKFNKKSYC